MTGPPKRQSAPPLVRDEAGRGDRLGSLIVGRRRRKVVPASTHRKPGLVLRDYQADAVAALIEAFGRGENPVASLPTGSGKSVVAAELVRELAGAGRVVVTVPSRELCQQNERALRLVFPSTDVGVVCAALGRREFDRRVIVGTPQSLAGKIDFAPVAVVVDEAHLMPFHRGSRFARLFGELPAGRATRRVGLTATSFRTADGAIYGTPQSWFSSQPFEVGVADLVSRGFLAPVRYVEPAVLMTTRGIARSAGDYAQGALVRANLDRVAGQARLIVDTLADRKTALIFAVTVEHVQAFAAALSTLGEDCAVIVGDMPAGERRSAVADFRAGRRRIAVTVAAALTGLDVPNIDLIASCRPTLSPIIHTQSIGRGTRPADGKADCLVLDFAGNVPRFGPVHAPHFDTHGQPLGGIAPWRACKACGTYNGFAADACTHCGERLIVRRQTTSESLEFGTIEFRREKAALENLVRQQGPENLTVEAISVHAYRKRSDPSSISIMVSLGLGGDAIVRQWSKRFSGRRWRALWAMLLGDPPAPQSLLEAFRRREELVRPASVTIELDGDFWRVVDVAYGDDEVAA